MIDPAMCRPGRLDKLLYVDLPNADERADILKTLMRKVPLGTSDPHDGMGTDLNIRSAIETAVKERCEGYSGADLAALVREAGVVALKRTLGALDALDKVSGGTSATVDVSVKVGFEDFAGALDKVQPSVSTAQRRKYETLRSKFSGLPVKAGLRSKESDEKEKGAELAG